MRLEKAQRRQLRAYQDELEEVNESMQQEMSIPRPNRAKLASLLNAKRRLESQIAKLKGKLQNVQGTQTLAQEAHANREQALLTQDAAGHISDLKRDMESLDLDEAITTLTDGAQYTADVSDRLSEPILGLSEAPFFNEGEETVDEELDRMLRARDEATHEQDMEALLHQLPSIHRGSEGVGEEKGMETGKKLYKGAE